jgi:hypothetical protein
MDLQYELGRVAQVDRDIEAANARITELAREASKLRASGRMLPKSGQR